MEKTNSKTPAKMIFTTILPLIAMESTLELKLEKESEDLENGYAIVNRESLPVLDEFEKDRNHHKYELLSKGVWAGHYLRVRKESADSGDLQQIQEQGTKDNGERIDRFLLALNIIERLWSFRPDLRFSWFENNDPLKWRLVTSRDYYPLSTFDGEVNLDDFRTAASLTTKIDRIYTENNDDSHFPAIKTAFDALRLGAYAFNVSMRFLQEAIALEALCSTSGTEVNHRIATTCALLLGSGSAVAEKKNLYEKARALYGIRSAVIHGAGKSVKIEELKEIERFTRKILQRVLDDPILPNYRTHKRQKDFLLAISLRRSTGS